jgi:beta-glucosidase
MLTFENSKTVADSESPFAQQNLRYAAHNLLYTVANSNAVNGLASGATLTYHMAGWEIGVLAGTIALAVLVLAAIVWMIVRVRRHSGRHTASAATATTP